jgi:SAM-dependent methyltransferase
VGEDLPYQDNMFDLVIIHNALDHTFNPGKVLSETQRVLKLGGINHLAIHTYPLVWLPPLRLLKYIQGSKDHPWRYTSSKIKSVMRENSLEILSCKYGSKDELSIPDWLPLTLQLKNSTAGWVIRANVTYFGKEILWQTAGETLNCNCAEISCTFVGQDALWK